MKLSALFTTLFLLLFSIAIAPAPVSAEETDNIRTLEIQGLDNMRFDVDLIEAAPGETIRIQFTTVSSMPAQAMAHNIAIVDQDVDLEAFVMASIMARDNEFIAPEYEAQVIAHTAMLSGGESDTIEFTVPDTPGDYTFVCTFPGHYYAGMVGVLRVG